MMKNNLYGVVQIYRSPSLLFPGAKCHNLLFRESRKLLYKGCGKENVTITQSRDINMINSNGFLFTNFILY